jgi:hypothetical protein
MVWKTWIEHRAQAYCTAVQMPTFTCYRRKSRQDGGEYEGRRARTCKYVWVTRSHKKLIADKFQQYILKDVNKLVTSLARGLLEGPEIESRMPLHHCMFSGMSVYFWEQVGTCLLEFRALIPGEGGAVRRVNAWRTNAQTSASVQCRLEASRPIAALRGHCRG